jgi:hypothetical protein
MALIQDDRLRRVKAHVDSLHLAKVKLAGVHELRCIHDSATYSWSFDILMR